MIATNIDKNRLFWTGIRQNRAHRRANQKDAQAIGRTIADIVMSNKADNRKVEDIADLLQQEYGVDEIGHHGYAEIAYGIGWSSDSNEDEKIANWVGYYVLAAMGYNVPASNDYDAIWATLGENAENIYCEQYSWIENAVDLAKDGIRS